MTHSKILVVDDERMIRWSIQQALSKDGHAVATVETGEEAVAQAGDDMPDLVFLDITLPGIDGLEVLRRLKGMDASATVVMVTATEDLKTAVEAMRLGAYDFISKPFDLDRLRLVAQNALDRHELHSQVEYHRRESARRFGFHRIIGNSRKIKEILDVARRVARSEATTVLIQGESGTGKDLLAQAIHYEGTRAPRPFIPINCTALPEELLESELMGYEKGAFTDAKTSKKGLFETAHGGTIYLDEIGDMRLGLQAKLLRFIETKTFKRVGGHRDIEVDVRIIAATNRDLGRAVREGAFREDLYYRLNVIPIRMPTLRERPEDIIPLAQHLLALFNEEFKRKVSGFTAASLEAMVRYGWPGNVRELRNVIERGIILGEEDLVDITKYFDFRPLQAGEWKPDGDGAEPLPDEESAGGESGGGDVAAPPPGGPLNDGGVRLPPGGVVLEELELSLIRQALETQGGNQTKAAQTLGLSRDALRYRMKKHGIL